MREPRVISQSCAAKPNAYASRSPYAGLPGSGSFDATSLFPQEMDVKPLPHDDFEQLPLVLGCSDPQLRKAPIGFFRAMRMSPALRVLAMILGQECFILCMQLFLSVKSASLAVMTDTIYGGFDTICATINVVCEYAKIRNSGANAKKYKFLDDAGSCFSMAALMGCTVAMLLHALRALQSPSEDWSAHPPPNGWLVCCMVFINVVNDVWMLHVAYKFKIWDSPVTNEQNLNCVSGMMHVCADLLRCSCVLVNGVVILVTNVDPVKVDIIATIVLCTLVLVTATPMVRSLLRRLRTHYGS